MGRSEKVYSCLVGVVLLLEVFMSVGTFSVLLIGVGWKMVHWCEFLSRISLWISVSWSNWRLCAGVALNLQQLKYCIASCTWSWVVWISSSRSCFFSSIVERSATLFGDVVLVAKCRMLFSHFLRVSASWNLVASVLFHSSSCAICDGTVLGCGVIAGVVVICLFFPTACNLAWFRMLFSLFHSG